jgi:hypothetical protein
MPFAGHALRARDRSRSVVSSHPALITPDFPGRNSWPLTGGSHSPRVGPESGITRESQFPIGRLISHSREFFTDNNIVRPLRAHDRYHPKRRDTILAHLSSVHASAGHPCFAVVWFWHIPLPDGSESGEDRSSPFPNLGHGILYRSVCVANVCRSTCAYVGRLCLAVVCGTVDQESMTMLWPNHLSSPDGSGNLSAIVSADRAFPAAVAELTYIGR